MPPVSKCAPFHGQLANRYSKSRFNATCLGILSSLSRNRVDKYIPLVEEELLTRHRARGHHQNACSKSFLWRSISTSTSQPCRFITDAIWLCNINMLAECLLWDHGCIGYSLRASGIASDYVWPEPFALRPFLPRIH